MLTVPRVEIDEDIGHIDFETFSEADLRKVGGYRYARHPSTEVLIVRFMLPGDESPEEWLPWRDEPPARLLRWVRRGKKLGAHNAAFERNIWRYVLLRTVDGMPEVKDEQWVCTAAKAAASGLPRALEKALLAVGAHVNKDMEGSKLITRFCKPRKPTKADPRTRIRPVDDPVMFKRFSQYCAVDVLGEKELHETIPDLSEQEQQFYLLDLKMNDRGLPVNLPLVKRTLTIVQDLERRIGNRVRRLSKGVNATQVKKLLELFADRGLELENLRKGTVVEALKRDDLDDVTRELLMLRVQASKASTKKLVSMIGCADPDDWVMQGLFLFLGAHTGRYAGRLVQPQNFIRGLLKEFQASVVMQLLECGDAEVFAKLYEGCPIYNKDGDEIAGGPIDAISQCMRRFIKAPRGYELAVVDYTAIEARVLAWIAGEEHMLQAYRDNVDVYKLMAMKLYKLKSLDDVSDEQRRIAKNLVLGCGYQLGGLKFVDYAANAGVVIEEDFAIGAVKTYRKEHPAIVKSWRTVEQLVVEAIRNPGKVTTGLKCRFYMREHWLCIQLPSGRELRYPYARAVPTIKWDKPAWNISFRTEFKGKFIRENTYGGKLIENIVQAIARDVMMEGMQQAETNGYSVIGTVHDEALTLRKKGTSDVKKLEALVCNIGRWGRGIPLAAKGFVTVEYKKD